MFENLGGLAEKVGGNTLSATVKYLTKHFGVVGILGQLPFVCSRDFVLTFKNLSRETSVRWAKHDVIGKKPVLEFVGEELKKVRMTIRFDSSLGISPTVGLDRLQSMMDNKQYKTLIIGGEYLGRYLIESISETRKFHDGAGVCIVAEASISLIEYNGELVKTTKGGSNLIKKFKETVTGK